MIYECKPCHISGPIKQRCPICSTPMIPRVPAGPEPLRGDDGLNNRSACPARASVKSGLNSDAECFAPYCGPCDNCIVHPKEGL